jgi:hypothetical protein
MYAWAGGMFYVINRIDIYLGKTRSSVLSLGAGTSGLQQIGTTFRFVEPGDDHDD